MTWLIASIPADKFANMAALPAANSLPADTILRVARPLGSGYFRVSNPGQAAWVPMLNETVALLGSPESLTAVGTAYVQLATANLNGLFPDGSEWEVEQYTYAASSSVNSQASFDINGTVATIGQTAIVGTGLITRRVGIIRREGNAIIHTASWSLFGNSGGRTSVAIDPLSFSIGAGITPGVSGAQLSMNSFTITRRA